MTTVSEQVLCPSVTLYIEAGTGQPSKQRSKVVRVAVIVSTALALCARRFVAGGSECDNWKGRFTDLLY